MRRGNDVSSYDFYAWSADRLGTDPVWWAQIRPGPDSAKRIHRMGRKRSSVRFYLL